MNKPTFIKILIGSTILILLLQLLIFIKVIPYDITWGGKLKSDQEMYVFVTLSLIINAFFLYVLLQKGNFIKNYFSDKTLRIILWVYFAVFVLNTIGNIFAKTFFEKCFAIVTLIYVFLLWKINKPNPTK